MSLPSCGFFGRYHVGGLEIQDLACFKLYTMFNISLLNMTWLPIDYGAKKHENNEQTIIEHI